MLHGIHDKEWIEKQLEKFPDSKIFRRWLKEEKEAEKKKVADDYG